MHKWRLHSSVTVWRREADVVEDDGDRSWQEERVAASGVTDELTALEQARSRLEAALAGDEHWRALMQAGGAEGAVGQSAARRARNRRLEMALAENSLYQAWRHLNEAIAALRESATLAERSATPAADGVQAGKPAPARPPTPAGARAADADRKPRNRRGPADPEEATVTFVRRQALLPSAELPADLGSDRASALFERLRGLAQELASPQGAIAARTGDAEEAEVVIVPVESAQERREAEERAGTISRLRKALSGE